MFKHNFYIGVFWVVSSVFFDTETTAQIKHQEALYQAVEGLSLRSIGPALMGGRIAHIAVSETDASTWYIAAGSGGVWKTTNSGITWTPVFDDQTSYSVGTLTIDPNNKDIVWVGTGENVSGRHVGWGDGVYQSRDGGATWKSMGIKGSEHIGKILIDPRDSDVIWVAAEGPLWSSGGERGVYKSQDGGNTWRHVLEIDENTGVSDLEFDPLNPDVVYAAAYQRRRHTWSLLAGGPQSGIYKTINGGKSWGRLKMGLPKGDMGKIGLAVTLADAQIVYATIEANDEEKGFYRSTNKGESWEKQNGYISGGTGPHYYQEIEVSQEDSDLIYQMDVFIHVSRDGGNSFNYLGTGREKHSDNHALWIDPKNGQHLLAGTDAGLYESFDEGTTWRHFPNLPISQFYKLGLDQAEPFYNIVGGAQDLGTLIGPARTMNIEGVRNQDWFVPLGADGYDSQFDPENDQIAYMEIQQGLLHRYDAGSQEVLNIQPQTAPNDPPERWNWDSPIEISPHNHKRLYFGSQRVWRSEDQGSSWKVISPDLTTNTNRYTLEISDRIWSTDALYDNGAMSKYATLTSLAESALAEGLLYTGSDDGLIHVSEDGGVNWRKSASLPGVPIRSFINDIEASSHHINTLFVIADAHKLGDYNPYIFISNNRGRSWDSLVGDLPAGLIVWVIKQDHKDENLLFIGTERGLYFSINKGKNWIKLKAGVPTIPFRDIELHARDNDLVGATFGRGFYVLDDYSILRTLGVAVNNQVNMLFPVRDAWWYIPNHPMQAKGMPTLGSTNYVAENPPFGAVFTYYIHGVPKTGAETRKAKESNLREKKSDIPFPGWEVLREQANESEAQVLLLVKDEQGQPIRWIEGTDELGLHRVSWDLRFPSPAPINLKEPAFKPPWAGEPQGPLAAPGKYTVTLYLLHQGVMKVQGGSQNFEVKPVPSLSVGTDVATVAAFQKKTSELMIRINGTGQKLVEAYSRLEYLKKALKETPKATAQHFTQWDRKWTQLNQLQMRLYGDPIRKGLNEATSLSISGRIGHIASGHWETRQNPTQTYQINFEIGQRDFAQFRGDLEVFLLALEQYETALAALGAPYTRGRKF